MNLTDKILLVGGVVLLYSVVVLIVGLASWATVTIGRKALKWAKGRGA